MPNISQNTTLPLEQLYLDPENYRFRDNEYFEEGRNITNLNVQRTIFNIIVGNIDGAKNYPNVADLLASFMANGFVPVDKIQVQKIEEGVYKVLEGNRRIATLKHLKSKLDNGDPIGQMSEFDFNAVPVELYEDENPVHFRILMGLKHISGNRKWEAINQAELVKDLINLGENPYDIADKLGISMTALNRYRRTLALIEEYKIEYKRQFRPRMFILFEEVIKSPDIKRFIGWDDYALASTNVINRDRLFSWFSTVDIDTGTVIDDLDDDETGSVADNTSQRPPIIKSQDDVRDLKKIISNEQLLNIIEITGNLSAAKDMLKQDSKVESFKDALWTIESGQDAAFRTIPLEPAEFKPKFLSINNKHDLLKSRFGVLKGEVPMSDELPLALDGTNVKRPSYIRVLYIGKYRKLKNLKIEKLTRVNLFAGGNNGGKSSLLEAIYLACKGSDTYAFNDIMTFRRKILSGQFSFTWSLDYLESLALPIRLELMLSNDETISASFDIINNTTDIFQEQFGQSLKKSIKAEVNGLTTTVEMFTEGYRVIEGERKQWSPVFYHTSQTFINNKKMAKRWGTILENKQKDIVIDYLNNWFFANETPVNPVKDIDFTSNHDGDTHFVITRQFDDAPMWLYDFGDGMQRCFSILLDMLVIENGVLLIDELENGIHYSNLPKVANFICNVAAERNLQVFITTHSLEAMKDFLKVEKPKEVSYHSFTKNSDGRIVIDDYTAREFYSLTHNSGADIR